MAIAFNLEKQEEIRDYIENKKMMISTPLRVESDTRDMVSEVANEEKEAHKEYLTRK